MNYYSYLHLLTAIVFFVYGTLAVLKNRKSRLLQFLVWIFGLMFIDSVCQYLVEVQPISNLNVPFFVKISAIVKIFLPPSLVWFVLLFSRQYGMLKNRLFLSLLFVIPILMTLAVISSLGSSIGHNNFGYYHFWSHPVTGIIWLFYLVFTSIFTFWEARGPENDSMDLKRRALSKTFVIGVLIIFTGYFLHEFTLFITKEKFSIYYVNLFALAGSTFLVYALIKNQPILFSSSVLSENILENLAHPIVLLDENLKIRYYNKALVETTAFKPVELIGKAVFKLIPKVGISDDEFIMFSRNGISNVQTELKSLVKDNFKIKLSTKTIFDHSGNFQGIVCMFDPIHKSDTDSLRLLDDEQKVMEAFKASDKGYWYWDIGQRELFFSEEVIRMLGYLPEEKKTWTFTEWGSLLHPEDYERYFSALNSQLKGTSEIFDIQYRIQTKEGKWLWFQDRGGITARNANYEPDRFSGMITDITYQKNLELELQQSHSDLKKSLLLKNKMADFLSTSIREPFNTLIGLTEVARYETQAVALTEYLKSIQQTAQLAYSNLEKMLLVMRTEQMEPVSQKTTFNLDKLLKNSLGKYTQIINSKNIDINYLCPESKKVYHHKAEFQCVVDSLLKQVFTFASPRKVIRLICRENNQGNACVEIQNLSLNISLAKHEIRLQDCMVEELIKIFGSNEEGLAVLFAIWEADRVGIEVRYRDNDSKGKRLQICFL